MNAIYFVCDLLFLPTRSFWNTVKIVILEEEGVYYYFLVVVLAVECFLVFHKTHDPSWGMVLLMNNLLEKKFVLLLIMAAAVAF